MNSTLTLDHSPAISSPATAKAGFYEWLVLQSFKPFVHGGMRMTYPDGRVRVFGAPGAEITAEMRICSMEFFKRSALFVRECGIHQKIGEWIVVVLGL